MDPGKYNRIAFVLAVLLVFTGGFFVFQKNALATTGINEQVNFQGRLVNTNGTNIADGTYNMEFKIYQDGDGVPGGGDETLKWTEDRLRNNSQGVVVADGIFQINLGSVTAFSGIDWNQSVLWVSINVGNTNATCTPFSNCVPDGEMNPMVRFTAAPYALNADKVSGLTVTDTTGTLTIANSKTVQFADAFTVAGAFATTLTATNTTNATLPAGTVTLAALGTAQTWTAAQTFANSTATDDTLGFNITTGGAGRFAGTLTNAELTGAHSWILPNADGTVALTANKLSVFAATTSAELSGVLSDENTSGGYMTDVMTTAGDLIYGNTSGVPARLAGSGTNGWVLTYNTVSNAPEWAVGGGGGMTNPMVEIGDMIYAGAGGTPARLDGSAADNYVLKYDLDTNVPFWAAESGGAGPWTDGTDITYLTDTTNEDFAVGSSTLVAPFSVDEENNTARIGDGSGTNGKINMYASDGDTGTITYNDNDVWSFEGGRVAIGANNVTGTTERMLQVGSETERGNSVTYGEVATKGLRDITGLANIKDVFVYDTTADGDGGRWIDWATTDKLSWYTESLDDSPSDPCNISTDDRCYSQSFPRKAILVVTSNALYIFDATNNVMWMKFSQHDDGWGLGKNTGNDPSSVTALNGVIYIGTNGGAASDGTKGTNGLYAFDFTQDRMWYYDDTDRSGADVGIGSRNGTVVYNSDNNTAFDLAVSGTIAGWKTVNDVSAANMQFSASAIAVASIPANGVNMVALATDSGLTVINMSHQKVLQYSDATDNDYNAVAITRTAKLYGLNETLGQLELWTTIDIDQVSEINGAYNKMWDETAAPGLSKNAPTVIANAPDALEVVERGSLADGGVLATAAAASSSDLIYVGTNQGLTEIHDHATPTMGWVKYYNTTRQTAIMPATIKRYLPMDEASGDLNDASIQGAAGANNRTMMPMGSPTFGVNGVRGKGMTFNGTSSFICSDNNTAACATDTIDNMSTTAWNITVWFKHSTAISGTDMLYNRCYNTTPAQAAGCAAIFMTSAGVMNAVIDDDATWTNGTANTYDQYATSTQTYNDNQWHFATLQRTNALGILFSIDGKAITLAGTAPTLTIDASQIVALGADCSVGAACATGANFWDGSIDEFTFSNSTTTIAGLTAIQMRRLYNDGRPVINRKVITVTDATAASSTTLTDSGEAWIPNELAGEIVEITGGTDTDCTGITRRISSNTAIQLTFSPAVPVACTLDTSTDFEINPEALFGSTSSVTAIGVTGETALGEARMMCVGTNDGSDGGGVTCYNHQAGPNVVADVYHSQASQIDDYSTEWTGTDYDDVQSIDLSGRAMAFGSMAHMWTETQDVRLGQGMDYLSNKIFDIRNSLLNLGMQTLAGSNSVEVGLTGGADLAEYYNSSEPLEAGMIVSMAEGAPEMIQKSNAPYQKNIIGIIATQPGMVLGSKNDNSYPVALSGRVPVLVTTENGTILKGDQITASSLSGYGMVAIETGRVIGMALETPDVANFQDCPVEAGLPIGTKCGQVMAFVNLTDFTGMTMADLMTKKGYDAAVENPEFAELFASQIKQDAAGESADGNSVIKSEWTNIFKAANTLGFMKQLNDPASRSFINPQSEIFAKSVNASGEVVSPLIVTDTLIAKNIKAENIEGLQFIQTGIASAQDGVAGNTVEVKSLGQQLADLQGIVKSLSGKADGLDASAVEGLAAGGGLAVGGPAEFKGSAVFKAIAEFIGKVIFRNNVEFAGTATFNNDTAGYAIIKEGQGKIEVVFEKPYETVPVINASLSLQQIKNDEVRKAAEELLLVSDVKFIITNVTTKGFEIRISQQALSDISFSWQAVAVKDAKTFAKDSAEPDNNNASASDNPKNISPPVEVVPSAKASGEAIIPALTWPVSMSENTVVASDTSASGAETTSTPAIISSESAAN